MSVGIPESYKDVIVCDTEIHFSWANRVSLLFGGVCWLRIETYCEISPGKVESKSSVMAVHRKAFDQRVKRGVHVKLWRRVHGMFELASHSGSEAQNPNATEG